MTNDYVNDYLAENERLAILLQGRAVQSLTRLLETPTNEEPRLEWGPALLTTTDGVQWLIDCEESRSNILLLDPIAGGQLSRSWYGDLRIHTPIFKRTEDNKMHRLLDSAIAKVERISREPSPSPGLPHAFAMCGLRITTATGNQVYVGTHLTDPMYPQVAFLLPEEVDSELTYVELQQ